MPRAPGSFDDQIVDLIRTASFEEATDRLAAEWESYLPSHAATLAERILSLPEESWEREPNLLVALARTHRAAPSSNPFAALAYLDAAAGIPDLPPGVSVLIALVRSRSLRGLGRFADARAQALLARQLLGSTSIGVRTRLKLEARTLFEEGASLALMGELDAAARQIRHGLGLASDRSIPGALEGMGWLAVTEYFFGSAAEPTRPLADAATLAQGEVLVEHAPALLAESLIAIDEGDEERAQFHLARLEAVADGTEFAAFTLVLRAALETSVEGGLECLDLLQAAELATHDWQAAALVRSLHDNVRTAVLIQTGSLGAARDAVAGLPRKNPLHSRHADCPAVLRARLALTTGDYEGVLSATSACRTMGDRHAPRTLAVVDVLRAAAHCALGDAVTSAETLDRALHQAARTGWRKQFRAIPPTRLSEMLQHARSRPQPADAQTVLDDLEGMTIIAVPDTIAPLSSRERVVLARMAAGDTRRQISSQLRVSPNTVKAQVRSIYRKLGASNRHEAVERATRFGIAG